MCFTVNNKDKIAAHFHLDEYREVVGEPMAPPHSPGRMTRTNHELVVLALSPKAQNTKPMKTHTAPPPPRVEGRMPSRAKSESTARGMVRERPTAAKVGEVS